MEREFTAEEQVELFKEFIEKNYLDKLGEAITTDLGRLEINFEDVSKFSPDLAEAILDSPEEWIRAGEIAIREIDSAIKDMRIRFRNLPQSQRIMISEIRSKHINKLVQFRGIVKQKSEVRPQVTRARFECPSCGNIREVIQFGEKFTEPGKCSCGRKGGFRLISKDLIDVQRMIVEESPEELEGGEQPKRIAVLVKEDLVSPLNEKRTNPGSKVEVVGVIKEIPLSLRTGGKSTRYDLIVEANNIIPIEESFSELKIDPEEEAKILELAQDPKIFEKIVKSIAPSIYGHEKIKEALVLQLFGGVRKKRKDGVVIRGDIHVLLVGDPGSGKSQLLKRIAYVAPKARYVGGKGISGAGLTATVVRDEFLRGWALEAGALVLANGGVCCIDELDKMSKEDRDAMHEALEQQTVTISKANIQATLRAETTVLAAANPKFGRFDPYEVIAKQIDLPSTLINRFDLIFPIKDIPKKERDEEMTDFILKLHKDEIVEKEEIPTELLRKYIAYARQKIRPKLTQPALEEIKQYYLKMRSSTYGEEGGIKPIPISARQLEALIRLSEASAKTRLSKRVTKRDARKAIELLHYCLTQVGMDPETGRIDIDRLTTGVPASQRSHISIVREIINTLEERFGKEIPEDEIYNEAREKGLKDEEVEEIIEKLKRAGDLFNPRKGYIQKI